MKKTIGWLAVLLVCSFCAGAEDTLEAKKVRVKTDQVYGHKYGLAMTFDVYTPAKRNGAAVLFINSGGYVSGQSRQCEMGKNSRWTFIPIQPIGRWNLPQLILEQYSFERLLAAGFTVFDVRHGSNPKFMIDEIFEDCSRAVRHIKFHARDYGIDAERIGLWGGSAGGHLALLLATHVVQGKTSRKKALGAFELNGLIEPELETSSRVKTVAVYYPAGYDLAADVREFPFLPQQLPALNAEPAVLEEMSIKKYLAAANPPALIIYGDQDFPFIVNASKNIAEGLQKNGVEVKTMVLPGVAHEFRGKEGYKDAAPGRLAMSELVDWFKAKLLK